MEEMKYGIIKEKYERMRENIYWVYIYNLSLIIISSGHIKTDMMSIFWTKFKQIVRRIYSFCNFIYQAINIFFLIITMT